MRGGGEISRGDGNLGDEVLVDSVDVELQLGGDGDDGAAIGDGTTNKLQDRLVVLASGLLAHEVDLVLENDDVVQLHDLNGGQMLRGLGLRAGFVSGNKEEGGVHDSGARQHGAHENVVTRAVDEAMGCQRQLVSSAVCKTHETCLSRRYVPAHPSLSHEGSTSLSLL